MITGGKALKARQATLCALFDGAELTPFDQALVLFFAGPASFTGEDVLELHLHGGPAVIEKASKTLLGLGAEPAGPGEFTRRAFENGKLDLVQAEAVADIIDAQTEGQLAQAQRQLSGALGGLYAGWREDLTMIRAQIEACIDFPEEDDVITDALNALEPKVNILIKQLDTHLSDQHRGERIRSGFNIALIGAVNAGKSTLLNRLAGEDAAIVSPEPGTTRDVVRVRLNLNGFLVELADTAGLRETDQAVEKEGIKRTMKAAKLADMRILVLDSSRPINVDDGMRALLQPGDFIVLNKSDLVEQGASVEVLSLNTQTQTHTISAQKGLGTTELLKALGTQVTDLLGNQESASLTRVRHRLALEDTRNELVCATQLVAQSPELAGEHLREANAALGQITGEADTEEVLGKIFSAFCIGK